MKRALLIAGGTLGGLGAVLAITPPQFSTSNTAGLGGGIGAIGGATSTPAASKSSTAVATKSATAKPDTTKKATATKAATAAASASATPVATQTTAAPAPASKGVTGTFTGPTVNVNYGNVQVQITVKEGMCLNGFFFILLGLFLQKFDKYEKTVIAFTWYYTYTFLCRRVSG